MKYFIWWWYLMLVIGIIIRSDLLASVSVICANMHYLAYEIIKKIGEQQ